MLPDIEFYGKPVSLINKQQPFVAKDAINTYSFNRICLIPPQITTTKNNVRFDHVFLSQFLFE